MKDLLYKELKLAKHPTLFIFPFLGAMLLIPGYPYMVAYIYTCLSVFFIFLNGRENKDILFTVSLPVRKRDTVKARLMMIAAIELFQILFSVPFAFLSAKINPGYSSNLAGMEANVAFFGFVFGMYGLFNIVFLPVFYRSAYRAGRSLFYAGSAITIYIFRRGKRGKFRAGLARLPRYQSPGNAGQTSSGSGGGHPRVCASYVRGIPHGGKKL